MKPFYPNRLLISTVSLRSLVIAAREFQYLEETLPRLFFFFLCVCDEYLQGALFVTVLAAALPIFPRNTNYRMEGVGTPAGS